MKKAIILLGIVGSLFAARYPIVVEYNYLKGCTNNRPNIEGYCICTLNELEKKYTLDDFMAASQNKTKAREMIKYAVNKCVEKIKK